MVYVPPLERETAVTPTPNQPARVHINSATVEELETLPGIGPSLAQAIIDYRDEHGPFASLDDLDNVPGMGPAKLDAIREQVVFD
jgi:comEA protein